MFIAQSILLDILKGTQMTQMQAAQINRILECKICAACICVICVPAFKLTLTIDRKSPGRHFLFRFGPVSGSNFHGHGRGAQKWNPARWRG